MKFNGLLAGAAFSLAISVGFAASAATQTLNTSGEGWITQGGNQNGSNATNNTLTGNCGLGDCGAGEYRSFFSFDIPTLSSPLTAATLLLYNYDVETLQSPTITMEVTSTGGLNFADLGTGTFFGSRTYTAGDSNQAEGIVLNQAALAAIGLGGGTFTISGRITSPTTFSGGAVDQFTIGSSDGQQQLELTSGGVPEPASWALMISGFGLAGVALRRRSYRLIEIAADGTRLTEMFAADNDEAAVAQAASVAEGVGFEVWRSERLVRRHQTTGMSPA
jgi:hypothetical protein